MKIFLFTSIVIILILSLSKNFIYWAKRNLFKDQIAWSGNDIKINHIKSKERSEPKAKDNYLKIIADESKIYLDKQSLIEEENESGYGYPKN